MHDRLELFHITLALVAYSRERYPRLYDRGIADRVSRDNNLANGAEQSRADREKEFRNVVLMLV